MQGQGGSDSVTSSFLKKISFYIEKKSIYLLVCHKKVIDSFDTYEKAAEEGVRKFGVDENFLVYHLVETEPLNFVYSAVL